MKGKAQQIRLRERLNSRCRDINAMVEFADGIMAARDHGEHLLLGGRDIIFVTFDQKVFTVTDAATYQPSADGMYIFGSGATLEGAKQAIVNSLRRHDSKPIIWFEPWKSIAPQRQLERLREAIMCYQREKRKTATNLPPTFVEMTPGVIAVAWGSSGPYSVFYDKKMFSCPPERNIFINGFPDDVGLFTLHNVDSLREPIIRFSEAIIRHDSQAIEWQNPPSLLRL